MDIETLVECFKALSDKTRLTILAYLRHQELCVCELVELLNISQPAVSQHLRKMRSAKLLKERKQGQWVYYSIDGSLYPYLDKTLECLPDLSHELTKVKATCGEDCCK